ncbi:hypothetical protein JOM56_000499 [Amanita muscaria]
MTLPILPQEVFDEIVSQFIEDTSTLKSCSLVCHSFRRKAQKMLFDSIAVTLIRARDGSASQPFKLVLIVQQAPHLIKYIQKLHIFGDCGRLDVDRNSTDLPDALGIFSRKGDFPIKLRSLWLEALPWHNIPFRLQDALVLLMTVPSLRDISLDRVMDCPANLVQNLPPLLKDLSLKDTAFSSLPMNRKELPRLEAFTIFTEYLLTGRVGGRFPRDAVERIVDISQVKIFLAGISSPYSMSVIEHILRQTSNSFENLMLQLGFC